MSTSITKEIACPNCGVAHTTVLYTGINVSDHPELKEAILKENLFNFRCDECGYTAEIAYPLVYHDPLAGYMIILADYGQQANSENAPDAIIDVTKRRVSTLAELKEKILIFDAGYDDVAIELVKNALCGIISKTYQNSDLDCYFSRRCEDGSLEFAIFFQGSDECVYHATKQNVYDQSVEILRSIEYVDDNDFIEVNKALADELLEIYKSI